MVEVSKRDWKLFREKLPKWQETYMERLCREYVELLTSDAKGSEKFWALEKRIKEDRKDPGVIVSVSRSNMIYDILGLLRDEAITLDDLAEFSGNFRNR
ncbi:MAG: multidrug transporter [Lachnospiraceae bacterium]|nr:multidrug transporter [Lachnospiraceae bacterium]